MKDIQETSGVQNELRRVVDALPGLVWTALPDGHIDFLNHRWCEYTGLSLVGVRSEPVENPSLVVAA